jgi:hypothetical protein
MEGFVGVHVFHQASREFQMTAKIDWLAKGDRVIVHGEGSGVVDEVVETDDYPGSYALVVFRRVDYHEQSRKHVRWTERKRVLLDVYPPHLTKITA